MSPTTAERTVDAFLGGRLEAIQPGQGHHRSGIEALLLSAAIDAKFGGRAIDLGAGAGVAGMAIAARCPDARVTLVERDAEAIACAHEALALPANTAFRDRVAIIAADIATAESERVAAGIAREDVDVVVTNPPFRDPGAGTVSPNAARHAAHVLEAGVEPWVRAAASALKPGGRLVLIFRASGLPEILAALAGRFGDVAVLPVHPRAGVAALRVLVTATKGSRGEMRLLPSFVLHSGAGGAYAAPAEQILRHGAAIAEVHPSWPGIV
jgi:tRNA1(Val) A37 N6-methylase TrmN6